MTEKSLAKGGFIQPKAYYREGEILHSIFDNKPFKRIIAEVNGGFLVVYHAYFETALGTQVEFVSNKVIGVKQKEDTVKL